MDRSAFSPILTSKHPHARDLLRWARRMAHIGNSRSFAQYVTRFGVSYCLRAPVEDRDEVFISALKADIRMAGHLPPIIP